MSALPRFAEWIAGLTGERGGGYACSCGQALPEGWLNEILAAQIRYSNCPSRRG
jgi:hypothetical protein